MYWEGIGKISKLKTDFLQESLLLQPIIIMKELQEEQMYLLKCHNE